MTQKILDKIMDRMCEAFNDGEDFAITVFYFADGSGIEIGVGEDIDVTCFHANGDEADCPNIVESVKDYAPTWDAVVEQVKKTGKTATRGCPTASAMQRTTIATATRTGKFV